MSEGFGKDHISHMDKAKHPQFLGETIKGMHFVFESTKIRNRMPKNLYIELQKFINHTTKISK